MSFYRDRVVPHLIRLAMRGHKFTPYRERVLAAASGRVLEVGIGAGANLPFYRATARELIGIEPSPRLLAMARRAAQRSSLPVKLIETTAECIPLDAASVDCIVMTWTLCSVPDAGAALNEMRRVLKPAGRLLFVEHGLAPDPRVQRWQHCLTPLWKHLAGGCHLNRAMNHLIQDAGFRITRLNTGYMRGGTPMSFTYEGIAIPS